VLVDRIAFTIDTQNVTAEPGTTVLQAARQNDIYIPHLCDHPDLPPAGVCRLCLVEIEGRGKSLACRTTVENGMAVNTTGDQIDLARRVALELLIADHRGDCLSCAQNNDCQLQRAAAHVGIDPERLRRLRPTTEMAPVDDSNPFFVLDPNKCVLCGICVRTCGQLQSVGAIDFASRGYDTTVSAFARGRLADSRCESCGECVVRCPVGALTPKKVGNPSREVKTVCPYCGVGCGIHLGVRGGKVVSARGVRESAVNQGRLCVKGRYGHGFVNHPARLTSPLVRKDGKLVKAAWDEALGLVAQKFSQSKGAAFAAVTSAKCTNEENYLVQKFTRAVMGTNSIDHCARL
jgi:formate dehydrogenase major subunit